MFPRGRSLRQSLADQEKQAVYFPRPSDIDRARLCETLQQVRNRAAAGVRYKAGDPDRAGVNVDLVRLRKEDIADSNVERSGNGVAAKNEKPGLSFRFHTPRGIRRQIDSFENEMWVGNKKLRSAVNCSGCTWNPTGPATATAMASST